MIADIRYAFRMLIKNPGFTAVAVLSLALGIGATTGLYSAVYGVLISPYPYARPQTMWWPSIQGVKPNQRRLSYRMSEFVDLAGLPVFSEVMGTSQGDNLLLTGDFAPESLRTVRVTPNAFHFLGVPPILGRVLGPSDIQPDGQPEPVVMLAYRTWQRLFAGNPGAVGKTLRLNDQPYAIVGVMPPRFGWYTSDGIWIPMALDRRSQSWVNPLARLAPGISPRAAEEQLQVLHQSLAAANPSAFPKDGFTSKLINYLNITVASGEMQTSLTLLFGAVGFLLLIACANVANLQLARATARAREMAIRLSVGAARARLVRQLLTESVLLSLVGGGLGLLFAYWMKNLMVGLMPDNLVPNESRIEINGPVMFFCVIVSMLTGIIFGLAPALHSSRPDLTEALKDAGRGSGASARGGRTREVLVVVEVGLAVVLLVSGALTVRSFIALQKVNLGFHPDHVVLVDLPLDAKRYATFESRNRFARELLDRMKSLPGVQEASIGIGLLPFYSPQTDVSIEGQPSSEAHRMSLSLASADYLKTMGIALRSGRMMTAREVDDSAPLALVNEAALAFWPPGEDVIGKRLHLDVLEKPPGGQVLTAPGLSPYVTVIGVVANTRNDGLRNQTMPMAIMPYTVVAPPQRVLAVRAKGDPMLLMNSLRGQVREMDKDQPLGRPTTAEAEVAFQVAQPRFIMSLFGLFAALGLALAVAGIYSVLSYLVTRRSHEIGIRMALGAQPGDVLQLVIKAGGRLVVIGLVLGIAGGFGAARFLRSQLFEVTTLDPISLLLVVVLLSVVGLAACYIPARRATKVDPLVALRYE